MILSGLRGTNAVSKISVNTGLFQLLQDADVDKSPPPILLLNLLLESHNTVFFDLEQIEHLVVLI